MTDKPKSTAPGGTPARSAVALYYDRKTTPRVTAKGTGHVAEEILALAREHNIPLYEDAALASLLARIELGEKIPEKLYVAVAEVIAFAYRLSGKWPGR
jgi:flagellar biosynthesis protein